MKIHNYFDEDLNIDVESGEKDVNLIMERIENEYKLPKSFQQIFFVDEKVFLKLRREEIVPTEQAPEHLKGLGVDMEDYNTALLAYYKINGVLPTKSQIYQFLFPFCNQNIQRKVEFKNMQYSNNDNLDSLIESMPDGIKSLILKNLDDYIEAYFDTSS